jgi:hypothetical protein
MLSARGVNDLAAETRHGRDDSARDAMPKGGAVTLETANCHGLPSAPSEAPAERDYVVLRVRDVGTGMTVPAFFCEGLVRTAAALRADGDYLPVAPTPLSITNETVRQRDSVTRTLENYQSDGAILARPLTV